MPDREKLISLVEDAIEIVENEAFWTIASGLRDVIALLKDQEAVKPKSKSRHGEYPQTVHRCGNCNEILYRYYKYCPMCGRSVKWE